MVDDSALEAEAVRQALSAEFEVESFVDGGAVLERSANSPLPEVLVLDWVMPGITGIEICQFLRSQNDQLPILLLRSCPDSCGDLKWRILPVGKPTKRSSCRTATGGMRHGETYQEVGAAA